MDKKKTEITVLPDGSAFAVVPMDEAVNFIETFFINKTNKKLCQKKKIRKKFPKK